MSMNGDYMSLAEVDGAAPQGLAFTPGVDFDPFDPDEVEIVRLASERDYAARMSARERELIRQRDVLLDALRVADPSAAEQFDDW